MKNLSLIILALVFCQITVSAQPCLPTGITFNTQSQIDSFQIIHPNCTEIEGDVEIKGDDITNLNGLSVVTSIGGSLLIGKNAFMGNFGANPALTSLTGLEGLTSIGGSLFINANSSLTSLSGLDNVTSIGGDFFIGIRDGFGGGSNPVLTSLTGLEGLTSIGGLMEIYNNDSLTSLTELDNVTSIGGNLFIGGNYALTSLSGLDNIDANSIFNLMITSNISLSTCEVQSVCDYLVSPNGSIIIGDNTTGCNSQQEVEAACAAVSVENLTNEESFTIYPNPTTTIITVETATKGSIVILNLNGKKLINRQINEPTTTIDVSTLPSGVYILRFTNDKTISMGKLVKH